MAESDSTTNGCTPVFPNPIGNSATPNPLIHDHPGDTLHAVYCVLDLLEALPNDAQEGMLLDQSQVFGHACYSVFEGSIKI